MQRFSPLGSSGGHPVLGALKVVGWYALFATLWILLSDSVLGRLTQDPEQLVAMGILKGGLFVAVTALLLFVLVSRFGLRLAAREEEKNQAQLELRENEEMFKALAEGASDAFFVLDRHRRLVAANSKAWESLGYAPGELQELGMDPVDPELAPEAFEAEWAAVQVGQTLTAKRHHRRKDGTCFPVEIRSSAFMFKHRKLLLSVARDLTETERVAEEHRRMEVELQRAQKLESLGSLASGVAHDMNNVLAAIQSVAEVLKSKLVADRAAVLRLETITKATNRGRDLVRGLTHFARKDLREPEPVDLNRIIREEAELLDHTLLQRVKLVIDLEPALPAVTGEAGALGNVLMNLCVNAVDAMPRGGLLTLRTRRLGTALVELEVADTGEGMPPEVLQRAREPFFTTKPVGKGTGLGLAIVHGIVKAHGGTLTLQSEVGVGTSVRIHFPALVGQPRPAEAAEPVPGEPGRALTILLVDDDELIRASVPAMLQIGGHRTVIAEGGQEALTLLEQGLQVDLAILDLNMPNLSGAEVLAPLRALRPNLPVILATGFLDPATEKVLAGHDRVVHMPKPFSLIELDTKLKQLCP